MVAVVLLIIMRFCEKKRQNRNTVPRSSSYVPENVPQRAPAARSPAAPGSGSPWFRSPHTPSWTCSSTESLTYSNIHSVTRGHRGKETEGTACFRQVTEKKNWISNKFSDRRGEKEIKNSSISVDKFEDLVVKLLQTVTELVWQLYTDFGHKLKGCSGQNDLLQNHSGKYFSHKQCLSVFYSNPF